MEEETTEKRPVGRPPLVKEEPKELTKDEQITQAYQKGANSLQDLARIFGVSMDHVLNLTGNSHLATVQTGGDLIDAVEAGKGAELNYGSEIDVPFTLN